MLCWLATPLKNVWYNRDLAWTLTLREFKAGQTQGLFWVLVQPLFVVVLLTVAFTTLGGLRTQAYPLYILSGLVPWMAFAKTATRAPQEVVGSADLVKQVVFPLEALALRSVLASLPAWSVGLALVTALTLYSHGSLPWTFALLPMFCALQMVWMLGAALFLSALGVFWRSLGQALQMLLAASLYLLPILYLPEAAPARLRACIEVNPFSALVWTYQDLLFTGAVQHPGAWLVFAAGSVIALAVGCLVFHRLRPAFGDVL